METLFFPAFNFLVLVVLLAYYLRAPIREFVSARYVNIRQELHDVREQLRGAREKYEEFSAKLKAVDAEIRSLRDYARRDAEAMRERILSESKRVAETWVADSKRSSELLFQELRKEVRAELGLKIVLKVEKMLSDRLTGDDRARFRREFSGQMGAAL